MPGSGRFYKVQSHLSLCTTLLRLCARARVPELLKPTPQSLCPQQGKPAPQAPAQLSQQEPLLTQPEKARVLQQRPATAK